LAKYSRYELKQAAAENRRIGSWNGVEVYACSKYDYNASDRNYWVLYDDNNKLVYGGYVHGSITEKGNVNECDAYWYNVPQKKGDVVVKSTPATSGYSDMVVADEFFVRIDKEINELLANVKNMEFTV
jgi:hypothetical protein